MPSLPPSCSFKKAKEAPEGDGGPRRAWWEIRRASAQTFTSTKPPRNGETRIQCIDVFDGGLEVDTEQLLAFQRVVREGSFTRAARSLGIGQPAISARIQQLESAFPGPLLERGRRTKLTPLGEAFLPYANRALDAMKDGVEAGQLAHAGQRGHLRLATLGSLSGTLVGPALAKVVEEYPRLDWTVRMGEHDRVLELLLDGAVDLAIISWPCAETVSADLVELVRLEEPIVLVAHPKHPLAVRAAKNAVNVDEVVKLGRPLLLLRWWPTHHPEMLRLAQRSGNSIDVPMDTARHLTTRGAAVGFFTRAYISEDLEAGRVVEIKVTDSPGMSRESAVVRHAQRAPIPPAAGVLVDAIRRRAPEVGLTVAGRERRSRSR
jgi:DNA-binding transcriptional LysR family regulator